MFIDRSVGLDLAYHLMPALFACLPDDEWHNEDLNRVFLQYRAFISTPISWESSLDVFTLRKETSISDNVDRGKEGAVPWCLYVESVFDCWTVHLNALTTRWTNLVPTRGC